MEHGERWGQAENVTPAVGRVMELLDAERLAIAQAFDVSVRTIKEHYAFSYQLPVASIAEMNAELHQRGNGGFGPTTLTSRYVLEDAPFGLLPTVLLGRLVGQPATLHEAGLTMLSAAYGRDFVGDNDLLPALGFEQMSSASCGNRARTWILRTPAHRPVLGQSLQRGEEHATEPCRCDRRALGLRPGRHGPGPGGGRDRQEAAATNTITIGDPRDALPRCLTSTITRSRPATAIEMCQRIIDDMKAELKLPDQGQLRAGQHPEPPGARRQRHGRARMRRYGQHLRAATSRSTSRRSPMSRRASCSC